MVHRSVALVNASCPGKDIVVWADQSTEYSSPVRLLFGPNPPLTANPKTDCGTKSHDQMAIEAVVSIILAE